MVPKSKIKQISTKTITEQTGAALESVLASLMDTAQMFGVDTSAVKSQTTWVKYLGNSLLVAGLTHQAKQQLGAGIIGGGATADRSSGSGVRWTLFASPPHRVNGYPGGNIFT